GDGALWRRPARPGDRGTAGHHSARPALERRGGPQTAGETVRSAGTDRSADDLGPATVVVAAVCMTIGSVGPTFRPLPATLPIFPPRAGLLRPGAKLPLQIFEPRYLAMTRDALASDRLIGMIQPVRQAAENEGLVSHTAELYPIGCAGRITAYSETDDGRYL